MSRKITRKWKGSIEQKASAEALRRAIHGDSGALVASSDEAEQLYVGEPIASPAATVFEPAPAAAEAAPAPAAGPLWNVALPAAKSRPRNTLDASEAVLSARLLDDVEQQSSDVSALCDMYHLRREELGRLTGFSLRALAEWASGKLPSQPAQRRLHEVKRLLDALAGIVEPQRIPEWLRRPNPAFDRLTPLQVIELGEIDRLWAMVHDLGSGQPT